MNQRTVKKKVLDLLQSTRPSQAMDTIHAYPRNYVLKALFSGICRNDETLRWHAITVMGRVVAELADEDLEAARIVMRRFMWSLNDESGGIGWGVPESMAEAMVCHETLAEEYAHILVSFMREEGFYLEYELLQRGLMWGVGRLAQARPELLRSKKAAGYLLPYLDSPDPTVRGLAAWALGNLGAEEAVPRIKPLLAQNHPVRIYMDEKLMDTTTGELAQQALASLSR